MVKIYTKRPVKVQAIKFDGENIEEIIGFVGQDNIGYENLAKVWYLKTLEGSMFISNGDYIIKGVKGEFYPCKPEIFVMTYDLGNDDSEVRDNEIIDEEMLSEKQEITISLTDMGSSILNNGLNLFEILSLLEYHRQEFISYINHKAEKKHS